MRVKCLAQVGNTMALTKIELRSSDPVSGALIIRLSLGEYLGIFGRKGAEKEGRGVPNSLNTEIFNASYLVIFFTILLLLVSVR